MKKTTIIFFFFQICFVLNLVAQKKVPYKAGEYCSYTLSYGIIKAAYAEYEIQDITTLNNKTAYHIIAKGRTASFFDLFFKVRDRYETYINTETLEPLFFIRDVNEGGYIIKEQYIFNHKYKIIKIIDI